MHAMVTAARRPGAWAWLPFLLACCWALALGSPAHAARLAMVVGNDSYTHVTKLRNARNDARSIAAELEAAGFKVTRLLDGTRKSMNDGFDAFLRSIEKGDEVVFYFSGHGSQPPQAGPFLLPVDIEVSSERAILRDGLSLEQVVDDLNRRARFSLVIIDACRDDPFRQTSAGRSLQPGSSLSRIEPPKGTMIIMAASKGQQALDRLSDNDPVANGLFTRELVKQMRRPGISAGEMLKSVRANVERAAQSVNHAQRPSLVDESSSDFFFHAPRGGTATAGVTAAEAVAPQAAAALGPSPAALPTVAAVLAPGYAPQREFDTWQAAAQAGTKEALEAYLRQHGSSRYAGQARARLAALAGAAPGPQPTPFQKASGH